MRRFGLAVVAVLFVASASFAQTVYLQPGQSGVGVGLHALRVPHTDTWRDPLVGMGGGATLTPLHGLDISLQWTRLREDEYRSATVFTGVGTGYLVNGEDAKLGVFAGIASSNRSDGDGSNGRGTVGLLVAQRYTLGGRVAVVPQVSASAVFGGDAASVGVGGTPALHLRAEGFELVLEPSLSYDFAARLTTPGVALGVVAGF